MKITGRETEIKKLKTLFNSRESSFLAIFGRRRIGKTFLIRQVYQNNIVFECSGLHQKDMNQQLENFWLMLNESHAQPQLVTPPPKTWLQAFYQLRAYLNTIEKDDEKKVIFLDEISWFETPKSGFLAALDSFWNQYCTKRMDIILVICGSAASWIIEKVVNDRGGLHNRITDRIHLKPFTLKETQAFLALNNINLNIRDLTQLYMAVGGIPFYLKDIQAGFSLPQIFDQLFLGSQAILKQEFQNLYAALFKNNALHEQIIRALASKNKGLTRNEIIKTMGIKSSGSFSVALEELVQCDFVKLIYPINKSKEGHLYRLIDEYSLFYLKFLSNNPVSSSWQQFVETPAFKIWSGYAFENLCFKHTEQIKEAFRIGGIITNEYSWVWKGNAEKQGAQIDLVIDRADNCINVLEVKFHNDEFEITKEYEQQLRRKINTFKEQTKTKKAVFLTMLSVYGVVKNGYYLSVATNQLTIEDLF
ncbi:MAG: AAA family ATPase [Saprospiraceae bacterium]|nr:AAA family ATPase [Saprospiraceae bacterium]